jgi:Flp pilus assembly protein TadG
MTRSRYRGLRGNDGQTLVIFALALVALLAMVALIIDGGNAFAQQRRTQNGADAAAEAGAVELARRLAQLPPTGPGEQAVWDGRVLAAVNATATANGLTVVGTPEYTDVDGAVLGLVGTGSIPDGTQGVRAAGSLQFSTYIAGVIGLNQLTASATATAVTGYVDEVGRGGLIPLTFPVIITQCETGSGPAKLVNPVEPVDPETGLTLWPTGEANMVALPLCSNGPGNVGWIDWDPPAGGASDIAASIIEPDNGTITTPKWYFVAETGAVKSLDDEMDTWETKDILLPIFHVQLDDPATPAVDETLIGTCDTEPTGDQTRLRDCPAGHNGGTGQNQWYFLVSFGEFHLEHSYIQGLHEAECNDPSLAIPATSGSGSPINNCLIGYFNAPVIAKSGSVGSGTSAYSYTPLAIQLIK